MTWPRPSARTGALLHAGLGVPLVALWLWFGLVDPTEIGEARCSSCGIEGYVVAAHLVAAGCLGVLVAGAAAGRRRLREGVTAPGRVTTAGLATVAASAAVSLVWSGPFSVFALLVTLASLVLLPAVAFWWLVTAVTWWTRPPADEPALERRFGATLTIGWLALALLLPATFGWIWSDRVEWFVF